MLGFSAAQTDDDVSKAILVDLTRSPLVSFLIWIALFSGTRVRTRASDAPLDNVSLPARCVAVNWLGKSALQTVRGGHCRALLAEAASAAAAALSRL